MGRGWNDDRSTGFEPPVSAEDTNKIFGKQHGPKQGSKPRAPPAPGFQPRDPPLAEFLGTRNKMGEAEKPKTTNDENVKPVPDTQDVSL